MTDAEKRAEDEQMFWELYPIGTFDSGVVPLSNDGTFSVPPPAEDTD